MKTLVILYAGNPAAHLFDTCFDGKSACELSLAWAQAVPNVCAIHVVSNHENAAGCSALLKQPENTPCEVIEAGSWPENSLLHAIADSCKKTEADFVLFAWADCPFLNMDLTRQVIETHIKYKAEYTYAEGYPYGFAPEALDAGTAEILARIADNQKNSSNKERNVARDSLFAVIKTDINSFEVETVLADSDWRLYRFQFECSTRGGMLACRALWPVTGKSAAELSAEASACPDIVQTVPSFYTIQIEGSCAGSCVYCPYPSACMKKYGKNPRETDIRMPVDKFGKLVNDISVFSEQAVVALSAWGEPLLHPQFTEFVERVLEKPGLSVLVETTGTEITEEQCRNVCSIVKKYPGRTTGIPQIIWIVSLDAVDAAGYGKMHGYDTSAAGKNFAAALNTVSLLENFFPGTVYPQFLRTNKNEDQLEKFFRFWNEKQSPSDGKCIIQKYDNFAGLLPSDKPADLSPLVRTPCWHIRRDMTILADGTVPYCREWVLDGGIGNVFNESIESVWKKIRPLVNDHINGNYSDKCRVCDEYYTFNF